MSRPSWRAARASPHGLEIQAQAAQRADHERPRREFVLEQRVIAHAALGH